MDNVKTGSFTNALPAGSAPWFASALLVATLIPLGGCRICADCDETAYAAYGGMWQRTLRNEGRVGSMFDPAGGLASELVSRDTPEDPDALERARQEARGGGSKDPDRAGDDEEAQREKQDDADDLRDKAKELRERKLEDIEGEGEEELRNKELDDINVRIIPGQPMPPVLR